MSDQTQTIRVHQYAECSVEEADEHPHIADAKTGWFPDKTIYFIATCDARTPVRYLGCVEMPAPKKPRERVVYRFEEVAEPEIGEDRKAHYLTAAGELGWSKDPAAFGPTNPNTTWLRRTVERIAVEPEKWEGTARVVDCIGLFFCKARAGRDYTDPLHVQVTGENLPTREQAEADLPILKNLAEQYAAAHGATIEWRDGDE